MYLIHTKNVMSAVTLRRLGRGGETMKIAYEILGNNGHSNRLIKIYTSIEQLVSDFNADVVLDTNVGFLRIMEEE